VKIIGGGFSLNFVCWFQGDCIASLPRTEYITLFFETMSEQSIFKVVVVYLGMAIMTNQFGDGWLFVWYQGRI
jgi:hypothetical protein